MKVSVVIPAKNEEEVIQDCLDHLLRQTELPHEVIVVDNNSNDHTFDRVRDRQEQFRKHGISLVPMVCRYGNQIEARTMGFGTAKYEVVVTIDADTRLNENWIELVKQSFEDDSIVGVGGRAIYDNAWITRLHDLVLNYYRWKPVNYYFYGSNGAFRRSAYKTTSGLSGCRELMEKYQLQEPYDDLFLSFILKGAGQIIPVPELICEVLSRRDGARVPLRSGFQRLRRQFRESLFVQRYLRAKLERDTIGRQNV